MNNLMRLFLLLFVAVAGFSCASASDGEQEVVPEGAKTFYGDVQPILMRSCSSCHGGDGFAPFSLSSYEEVSGLGSVIVESLESGRMPPWPPEAGCGDFHGARVLAPGEIDVISEWVEGGMFEGQQPPADEGTAQESDNEIREPDLLLGAKQKYVPDPTRPDDYRCLVLDHEFDTDTFVSRVSVLPDQKEVVHHVLLFLVGKSDVRQLEALDEEGEGEGYTCFGGPGVGAGTTLGGWAPGGLPPEPRDGVAMVVPEGSKVVMQIHYNLLALNPDDEIQGDRTEVGLWLLEEGEVPEFEIQIRPLANGNIELLANDAESRHVLDYTLTTDTTIVGVTPHMHLLGTSIKLELIREGAEDQCMVHIPEWDFAWQQFYAYSDDAWVEAQKGDKLRLTCAYDNSPENQPVVNGMQQEPRDVFWGDGSLDEMCLNYITVIRPYSADDGGQPRCEGFNLCAQYCSDGDALCFFSCGLAQGLDCIECTMPATIGCGFGVCATESAGLVECMESCTEGASSPGCFMYICLEEYFEFYACMQPQIASGACDEKYEGCDIFTGERERRL